MNFVFIHTQHETLADQALLHFSKNKSSQNVPKSVMIIKSQFTYYFYSKLQDIDNTRDGTKKSKYEIQYRCCVIMLYYVNVIYLIDILTWRSNISVSLELECDMMIMSVNNLREHSQGQS